jgi:hypothetical protein
MSVCSVPGRIPEEKKVWVIVYIPDLELLKQGAEDGYNSSRICSE